MTVNYLCKKCRTLIQGNSITRPNINNCQAGSIHTWTNMGEVGSNNYQCKKCGILVKSKSRPTVENCPADGVHTWSIL